MAFSHEMNTYLPIHWLDSSKRRTWNNVEMTSKILLNINKNLRLLSNVRFLTLF